MISIRSSRHELLFSAFFLIAMTAIAARSGMHEIIFPEAAAIVCGAWIRPSQPWNVGRYGMLFMLFFGAFAGVLLNLYVPGPVWIRAMIGYLLVCCIFLVSGYSMAPMISAVILPILLGTTSFVYPVTVGVMLLVITTMQFVLVKSGRRKETICCNSKCRKADISLWISRFLFVFPFTAIAYFSEMTFLAAPPLLVLFTEFSQAADNSRKKNAIVCILVAAAGFLGSLTRYGIEYTNAWDHLPVICILTFLLFGAVVLLWRISGLWLPPLGAVAFLPLLIPLSGVSLYALEVTIGSIFWLFFSRFCPRISKKMLPAL